MRSATPISVYRLSVHLTCFHLPCSYTPLWGDGVCFTVMASHSCLHADIHSQRSNGTEGTTQMWLREVMRPLIEGSHCTSVGSDDEHLVAVVLGKAGRASRKRTGRMQAFIRLLPPLPLSLPALPLPVPTFSTHFIATHKGPCRCAAFSDDGLRSRVRSLRKGSGGRSEPWHLGAPQRMGEVGGVNGAQRHPEGTGGCCPGMRHPSARGETR